MLPQIPKSNKCHGAAPLLDIFKHRKVLQTGSETRLLGRIQPDPSTFEQIRNVLSRLG